jgi:hypothetical protein
MSNDPEYLSASPTVMAYDYANGGYFAPAVYGQQTPAQANAAAVAAVGGERSGDDLEERGLARAVAPDDAHDLAAPDLERDVAERLEALVPAAEAHELEQHLHGRCVDLERL